MTAGVKHVRIRSPTPMGLPPSLNDIVGEASPERAQQTMETRSSSSTPFPSLHSSLNHNNQVQDEVPEEPQHQDSELEASGAFGTTASSCSDSDSDSVMAMFIVGECEDDSAPPGPAGTSSPSESSITSRARRRNDSAALSKAASSEIDAAADTDGE